MLYNAKISHDAALRLRQQKEWHFLDNKQIGHALNKRILWQKNALMMINMKLHKKAVFSKINFEAHLIPALSNSKWNKIQTRYVNFFCFNTLKTNLNEN